MDVLISAVTAADIEAVVAIARRTLHRTYPGIISQEQIDFILEER